MRRFIFTLITISLLASTVLTFPHVLSSFNGEFKKMMDHHKIGDTSHAFSIAMKLFVAVETLKA